MVSVVFMLDGVAVCLNVSVVQAVVQNPACAVVAKPPMDLHVGACAGCGGSFAFHEFGRFDIWAGYQHRNHSTAAPSWVLPDIFPVWLPVFRGLSKPKQPHESLAVVFSGFAGDISHGLFEYEQAMGEYRGPGPVCMGHVPGVDGHFREVVLQRVRAGTLCFRFFVLAIHHAPAIGDPISGLGTR